MFELHKISKTGFSKLFNTEEELFEELDSWVCDMCYTDHWDKYGEFPQNYSDLLWTSCGCEFIVDVLQKCTVCGEGNAVIRYETDVGKNI